MIKHDKNFRKFNILSVLPGSESFGESVVNSNFELTSESVNDAVSQWRSIKDDIRISYNKAFNIGALAVVTKMIEIPINELASE